MDSEQEEKRLEINIPLCRACWACELACSFYLNEVCDPKLSRIKITRDNEIGEVFCELPVSCPECSFEVEPPCVFSCKIHALTTKS